MMTSESTTEKDELQPKKSSTELLSELFDMFDKERPAADESDKDGASQSGSDSDSSNSETPESPVIEQPEQDNPDKDVSETVKQKNKKEKKNKHKHKHKHKHKNKKKKKKHKHKSHDSKTSPVHDSYELKKEKVKDAGSESQKKAKKRKHSAHSSEDSRKHKTKRSRSRSPELEIDSPPELTVTTDASADRSVRHSDRGHRSPRHKHRHHSSGDSRERRRHRSALSGSRSRRSGSKSRRSRNNSRSQTRSRSPGRRSDSRSSRTKSETGRGDLASETFTPSGGDGGGGWQTLASPAAESPAGATASPAAQSGGWTALAPATPSVEPMETTAAPRDVNTKPSPQTRAVPLPGKSRLADSVPLPESAPLPETVPLPESVPLPKTVPLPESAPPLESVPLPPEPAESGAPPVTDQDGQLSAQKAADAAGRPARRGAIVIRSLKNSAVFEQAQEEARRRQAEHDSRYEDGELSESASEVESRPASPDETNVAAEEADKSDGRDPVDGDDGEITSEDNAIAEKKRDKNEEGRHKSKKSHKKGRDGSSHRKSRRRSDSSSRHRDRDGSPRDGSRSRHGHRDRHRSSQRRHGSRSPSRERRRSRDEERDRRDRDRGDRDRDDRGDLRERIDKRRLLEVARRNAQRLGEEGLLPAGLETALPDPRRNTTRDVRQLTEMCRRLQGGGGGGGGGGRKPTDDETPFHHPFAVKERAAHIVMNIRNAPQLPVKTHAERQSVVAKLSSSFPVSSGEQHRTKELEWVPVKPAGKGKPGPAGLKAIEAAPAAAEPANAAAPVPTPVPPPAPADSVFPQQTPAPDVDLNTIVSRRLTAMRQLQQDPHDTLAQSLMNSAQKDMQGWASSRQQPGRFNGSTGVRVLTAAELGAGQQAWAKKNQLKTLAPVSGGVGEQLLKKMGWKPGQGLGKNQDGNLTPLLLDVKMDKKGLVSGDERPGGKRQAPAGKRQAPLTLTNVKDVDGKHPISALMELCTKRRWGPPEFELCMDRGPAHSKHFLYKVTVNARKYQPSVDSTNKKLAKASAAAACLQALGLLPTDA